MNLIEIFHTYTYENIQVRSIDFLKRYSEKYDVSKLTDDTDIRSLCIRTHLIGGAKEEYVHCIITQNCLGTIKVQEIYFKDIYYPELVKELKTINSRIKIYKKYKVLYENEKVLYDEMLQTKNAKILWELVELEVLLTEQELADKKREKLDRYNHSRQLKRRNRNGLTVREQQKQDTINKVQKLKATGLKQVDVAKELNLNKSTVSRYWTI